MKYINGNKKLRHTEYFKFMWVKKFLKEDHLSSDIAPSKTCRH